jgi:hypothetical protein
MVDDVLKTLVAPFFLLPLFNDYPVYLKNGVTAVPTPWHTILHVARAHHRLFPARKAIVSPLL